VIIDQGMSSSARSQPRPTSRRSRSTATAMPSDSSIATVTRVYPTVKTRASSQAELVNIVV
jgi:hypothetical protein